MRMRAWWLLGPVMLTLGIALALVACGGDDEGDEATPAPYPTEIAWDDVPALLSTGEVESVFQTHDLAVTFHMKDGSVIETTEPVIDDIFRLVDECGDPCADVTLATE